MKRKKKKAAATKPSVTPTEQILVLKKRPIASLDEETLSDAAGGHDNTCRFTCPRTGCTCHATCMGENSCDEYVTCGASCNDPTCGDAYTCATNCVPPP